MRLVHRDLAAGRWFDLSLVEQLANVGSEVLVDSFWFDNRYGSTTESWHRYFHAFTHAAALTLGR